MTARSLILALGAAALAHGAMADAVEGSWSFETVNKAKGCTITGKMTIEPSETAVRACSFVSSEVCDWEPDRAVQVDQVCSLIEQGDRYVIRSQVVGALTEDYDIRFYNPDHFSVKLDNPSQMSGLWQDRNYTAPVVFQRDGNLPIS
ncbi:MAG: hypothetical protein AAFX03_09365 [Pseudomonadota bacterium]